MQTGTNLFAQVTEPILPLAADLAAKSGVILALAWIVARAMRGRSAALRHLVWSLAVVGVLSLPMLAALLPTWSLSIPWPWPEQRPSVHATTGAIPAPGPVAELPRVSDVEPGPFMATHGALGAGSEAQETPFSNLDNRSISRDDGSPSLLGWVLPAWAAGALLALLPLVVGIMGLRRLRRRAFPVQDHPMANMQAQLCRELGFRRTVPLLESSTHIIPMTWGILRPVILVPRQAREWSVDRLRAVLLHELAHVQRRDCLIQLLAQLARALYWFNPLTWLAVRRLRLEQERACDDAVLNHGARPTDYAESLLTITARLPVAAWLTPVALAMSRVRRIENRLVAILDPARNRRPLTRRVVGAFAAPGLLLLLGLATCHCETAAASDTSAPAVPEECKAEQEPAELAQGSKLEQVRGTLLQRYVKVLKENDLTEAAIRGMLQGLKDPYCEYLPPDTLAERERQFAGTLSGIGVQVRMTENRVTVITPMEDSPALKAGIRAGDMILEIDGHPTKGIELHEAVKRVLGAPGTVVKLKVLHSDQSEEYLAITRAPIKGCTLQGFRRGPSDRWEYLLDADHGIGYVHILCFSGAIVEDLRNTLKTLSDKGMKGLILDLRFCPGGMLASVVDVAQMFLDKGTIVTIKGEHSPEKTFTATGKSLMGKIPVVILVNPQTASAAEILAGTLRDNLRATLLGTRTYGKGSVQEVIKLRDEGALLLTTAFYHLPSGRSIQKTTGATEWGVDPTDGFYVPMDAKHTEKMMQISRDEEVVGKKRPAARVRQRPTPKSIEEERSDPQLAAALQTMIARITTGAFKKVGKSQADLVADLARRDEIEKRRAALLTDLEQLNKELADLEKQGGDTGKPKD
jgi:carboxyl-terminal processing protease